MSNITYRELQSTLKAYRDNDGITLTRPLNSKKALLEQELECILYHRQQGTLAELMATEVDTIEPTHVEILEDLSALETELDNEYELLEDTTIKSTPIDAIKPFAYLAIAIIEIVASVISAGSKMTTKLSKRYKNNKVLSDIKALYKVI